MHGPFSLWSPTFRFPLSGDVKQDIDPEFTTQIAGVPEIEITVIRDVASYGTQLGKVLDALDLLGKAAKVDLPEITALRSEISAVKASSRDALKAHAEDALARLRAVDEAAWAEVLNR